VLFIMAYYVPFGLMIEFVGLVGVCAGLLWTAQGSLMLAYATEARKGMYTATFWSILYVLSKIARRGFC
jgi:hypothetical protein